MIDMCLQVKKRDGRIVPYEIEKIESSIEKAMNSEDIENKDDIAPLVEERIKELGDVVVDIEKIQDIIEESLMDLGYNSVAKAYIIYREKRKRKRELRESLEIVDDLKLGLNAAKLLKDRYLIRDENGEVTETPSELFRRVARTVAVADLKYDKDADVEAVEELFYRAMINMEFLPNSPALFSAGNKSNTLAACFVLDIEDSLEDIFEKVKQTGIITKMGGGIGLSFSNLRPKNDTVGSTGGVSSGPVSFMRLFDTAIDVCKQGGVRRGALMGTLRVDHPDILEFIRCKQDRNMFTNFNLSVLITDAFMGAYYRDTSYDLVNPRNGEVVKSLPARTVMDQIVYMAHSFGDPGLVFIDVINDKHSVRDLEIKGVNVCVAGDTLISTDKGMLTIRDAVGKELLVMDGTGNLTLNDGIKKIRENEDVFDIEFSNGIHLKTTKDHELFVFRNAKEEKVKTEDLQIGDVCVLYNDKLPKFGKTGTYDEGIILGYTAGDGTVNGKSVVIYLYNTEIDEIGNKLADFLTKTIGKYKTGKDAGKKRFVSKHTSRGKPRGQLKYSVDAFDIEPKHSKVSLEVFAQSEEFIRGYLRGLFSADGGVWDTGTSITISLSSNNELFLMDIQKLLLSLGIYSKITDEHKETRIFYDKVYNKEYKMKPTYRLLVMSKNAVEFVKTIGFMQQRKNDKCVEILAKYPGIRLNKEYNKVSVVSVEYAGREDVYDVLQTGDLNYYANFIKVVDCGEQPLVPYESCLLGAINLSKFVKDGKIDYKDLRRVVGLVVHFLDNMLDVNIYPLEQIREATEKTRKIGVGVMGWAEMLIQLDTSYDSKEALELAEKVMGFIDRESHKFSRDLAVIRGNFPLFDYYKKRYPSMRNAVLTTAAPTGSRSILANTSSGIEPLFAVASTRVTGDGVVMPDINRFFISKAKDAGVWNEALKILVAKEGTVGKIEEIPKKMRALFKTAHEIPPKQQVFMQAAFQRHIGSSVSKTVNLNTDATLEDVKNVFLQAFETGCKGITVFRNGCLDKQVLYVGCDMCNF